MSDMPRHPRPLSPHLQIYRPQLTAFTSILTRITGNALGVSTIVIVWWLYAMTRGGADYERANWFLHTWVGEAILILSVWGLWYHYLAGIRHLIFDSLHGLDIATAQKLGWACIIGSVLLTGLTIYLI